MKIINGRWDEPSQNRGGTTFTGDVWVESVLPTTDGTTVNTVTFPPASRTHWHSHERGQLLQVVQGEGLVCSEGAPPAVIRQGDTVWVPAGERHWHGAGPHSLLTHVAVSLGTTSWEHEVSDQEYRAAPDAATEKESG